MSTSKLLSISFLNAAGVAVYVAAVAWIMQNGERIFGQMKNSGGPVAFLLLFVLSAAVTGSLVLGRPILTYLDGRKIEAVKMFIFTLGWLVLITGTILFLQFFI